MLAARAQGATTASILIVDDCSSTRATIRAKLEAEGFGVSEACNGAEALKLLVGDPGAEPGLIIVDLEMPIMSGWEFVRIAKSYHRLARIPLLILSGHEPLVLPSGAVAGYVPKPFTSEDLIEAVKRSLSD